MTAFNSKSGGFQLTTVGRVQTPTLAILVEREEKIRAFRPRDYWEVLGTFRAAAGEYGGRWFDEKFSRSEDDPDARAERLWDEARAPRHRRACDGQPGVVTEESKPTTQGAPLLYDLTSLQREANGRFGLSARTTLSLAQALYEKHKVAHLPADRLARAARGLSRDGAGDAGGADGVERLRRLRPRDPRAAVGAAQQADLRQREDLRPLRDHPDARPAQAPERAGGEALRLRRASASSPRSIPPAEFTRHHADHARGRRAVQVRGQGDGRPGVARGLRQGGEGRRGHADPGQAGRDGRDREARGRRQPDAIRRRG